MTIDSMTISHFQSTPMNKLSPLARLPTIAGLIVLAPILLTILTGRVQSPYTAAFSIAFPAYRFLLYMVWNAITIGGLYLVLHRRGVVWGDLGLSNFHWRDQALAIFAAAIGIFVLFPLGNGFATWIGLPQSQNVTFPLVDSVTLAGIILLPCILIPISEEILFRGFLLTLLQCKLKSPWIVGLLGSVMFGMMHIGLYGMSSMVLVVLLWSVLPVSLFLWRRSIWPTSTLHILNNLFGLIIVPLFLH